MRFITQPRILYGTIYFWNAVVGGKFLAPWLMTLRAFSSKEGDGLIGAALAFQFGLEALLGSWCGSIADAAERKRKLETGLGGGRLTVIRIGIILGSAVFLSYYISVPWLWWQFILRALFAVARSLTIPVLDGVTVAYLEEKSSIFGENCGKIGYGQERMYGAIGWGLAHVIMGLSIDLLGFTSIYGWTIASTVACLVSIQIFARSKILIQRANTEGTCLIDHSQASHTPIISPFSYRNATAFRKLLKEAMASYYNVCFFFSFFTLSIGMSVVENIVFLFYKNTLGSSNTMCGIAGAFTVLLEVPIFHHAPILLRAMNAGTMMILACSSYILRVVGYTLVGKMSFLVVCLDFLHGFSYALSQIGCVDFICHIVPEGFEASGQGLLILFRGSGSFLGLLIGGSVEQILGPRILYAGLAMIVSSGLGSLLLMKMFSDPNMISESDTNNDSHQPSDEKSSMNK